MVGDSDKWNSCRQRKTTELWQPDHGAVLIIEFADDAGMGRLIWPSRQRLRLARRGASTPALFARKRKM